MPMEDVDAGSFKACSICGRTFIPESLVRHEKICSKTQGKRRKVFDSGKQRSEGSDVPRSSTIKPKAHYQPERNSETQSYKKYGWREKHSDFVNAIRAARQAQVAIKTGGPLPPPPPPSINPDYIQCPYCGRRFNQKASERHIPFCKEQTSRVPAGRAEPVNSAVKARVEARKMYKVPAPKLKAGSSVSAQTTPSMRTSSSAYTLRTGHDPSFTDLRGPGSGDYARTPSGGYGAASKSSSRSHANYNRPAGKAASAAHRYNMYGDADEGPMYSSGSDRTPPKPPSYADGINYPDFSPTESDEEFRGRTNSLGRSSRPLTPGQALRTGRDPQHYNEARNALYNARYQTPTAVGRMKGRDQRYSGSSDSIHRLANTNNSSNNNANIGTPPYLSGSRGYSSSSPSPPSYPTPRGGSRRSAATGHGRGKPSLGGASSESGYHSAESEVYPHQQQQQQYSGMMQSGQKIGTSRVSSGGLAKFCHDCGSKYPTVTARFCCECGVKRANI